MIALLLLAAATPEAADLGRQLASAGTLATVAPLMMTKETEEIIATHGELSPGDKQAFRASADVTAERLRNRVIDAQGAAYTQALSIEDLRALVAFSKSDAAKHQRDALPGIMIQTMTAIGNIDFKGEAVRDFCKSSGKLCPKAP